MSFHINVVTGTNTGHRTVLLVRLPHPKGVAFLLWRRYSTGVDRDKVIIPTLQMIRSAFWEIVGLVQDLKPGTLTPSHSLTVSQSGGKDFYSAQGKEMKRLQHPLTRWQGSRWESHQPPPPMYPQTITNSIHQNLEGNSKIVPFLSLIAWSQQWFPKPNHSSII